ncbi:MAG: nitroreductase family deazaflavin-dependent oxidoreductase [Actinobacteria bacterium]|jgi:deazaflavin-dependent oxidoreductase (nitroreductase family)|nr:nitroreductase family deazaflavin-dependent oxidoreductase [Actinomycetota bacterium]
MGIIQELRFVAPLPNPPQRAVQAVAETKAGSWFLQRTMYRLDRPLHRWTDGRVTLPGLLTGLPVILLTTTGAKSGLTRTMPVGAFPVGGDLAVLGTNFAQPTAPAWVFNLEADPKAQVTFRDRTVDAVARVATDDEREHAWAVAISYYRGFKAYRLRITDRQVRIFILESASTGGAE